MAVYIFAKYILVAVLVGRYTYSQSLSNLNFDHSSNVDDAESNGIDKGIPHFVFDYDEIDAFIERIRSCKEIFGTGLAIVQLDENDNVVDHYAQGYGIVDPTDQDSAHATNKTQFCLGSITKQFTAATLGKHLVRKGKSFDSRLDTVLADAGRFFGDRDFGALSTVRDLLSHRMGIPRYDVAWAVGLEEERDAIWRRLHMLADDYDDEYVAKSYRSSFQYNNWMVTLAGYTLENITGHSWEEEINDTYFRPLDMSDSSFSHKSYGNPETFALPAYRVENGTSGEYIFKPIDPHWFRYTTDFIAPAGSICMSSEDMFKYLKFLVKTNVSEEMKPLKDSIHKTWYESSNPIAVNQLADYASPKEEYVYESDEYGLGVESGIYREFKIINHAGNVYGYNSFFVVFPGLKLGILLSNSQGYGDPGDYGMPIALGLFDLVTRNMRNSLYTADQICQRYKNVTAQPDPDSLTPYPECYKTADVALKDLVGDYRNPVFGKLRVSFNETPAEDGGRFTLDWGLFGRAFLCRMGDSKHENEFQLFFDTKGPFFFYNVDPGRKSTAIRFEKDVGGRGVKVVFPFLQNTAPSVESVTFTKVDYVPCKPSKCVNGGKCVPVGDFDYYCDCPKPLTGIDCEIAPINDCTAIKKYYPDTSEKSGVYRIEIAGMLEKSYNVFCDMETDNGGWTVLQRRTADNSTGQFYRNATYNDYVKGFGLPGQKYNYWMGLEAMRTLADSAGKNYTLRIELTDCNNRTVYEEYQNFWLGNATTSYTLHVQPKSATGSAGDALTVSNSYISHNNMPFSAPGKPDENACVDTYHSGWWFNNCFDCNLNGAYYDNCNSGGSNTDGVVWLPFHNGKYSMQSASMKIRRAGVVA